MKLRLLTYNVHRCVGTDRKLDVERVAEVIAAENADVVALQELDVRRARTKGVDQAHRLAELLKMRSHFHPAMTVEEELYGDAILTALPETKIKADGLPLYPRIPGLEPRGAIWISVDVGGTPVQIINTHLGLVPQEQKRQAAALLDHPRGLEGAGHPAGRLQRHALFGDLSPAEGRPARRPDPEPDLAAGADRDLSVQLPVHAHRPRLPDQGPGDGRGALALRGPGANGLGPPAAGGGSGDQSRRCSGSSGAD
jgi:endonuclease/exonuclease/phosphatase family metal-dependent hydrolase